MERIQLMLMAVGRDFWTGVNYKYKGIETRKILRSSRRSILMVVMNKEQKTAQVKVSTAQII